MTMVTEFDLWNFDLWGVELGEGQDWPVDPDTVPRAIVPISLDVDVPPIPWKRVPRHQHRKAELLYTVRGVVSCEIEGGLWIVPPQCALWIPGGVPHTAAGAGDVECLCLYIDPAAAADLPERCCTLGISSFLRELVLRANRLPQLYDADGRDGRLVAVLLDELATAPVENLHLPMPADRRLRQLVDLMLAQPDERASLQQWASRVSLSERSLSRLLSQETGMSFGQWRRQLHVITAIRRLTGGDSVQTIAIDLGYESASSFVTMFKKVLGKPPIRYLRSVNAGAESG